jgi:hypothetical protein
LCVTAHQQPLQAGSISSRGHDVAHSRSSFLQAKAQQQQQQWHELDVISTAAAAGPCSKAQKAQLDDVF